MTKTMKRCNRCGTTKAASLFGRNRGRHDGLSVYCSCCTKSYNEAVRHSMTTAQIIRMKGYHAKYQSKHRGAYRRSALNHYHKNKVKIKCRVKEFFERHPERRRHYQMKFKYNITHMEYEKRLKYQNFRCAICGDAAKEKNGILVLCIDHDHSSGKVRGLLCETCNYGVGHFKDDTNLLTKAISYLNTSRGIGDGKHAD
jgi:hypothetical protein